MFRYEQCEVAHFAARAVLFFLVAGSCHVVLVQSCGMRSRKRSILIFDDCHQLSLFSDWHVGVARGGLANFTDFVASLSFSFWHEGKFYVHVCLGSSFLQFYIGEVFLSAFCLFEARHRHRIWAVA